MKAVAALVLGMSTVAGSAAGQETTGLRRVVTGFSDDGRAVVVQDGAPEVTAFESYPGFLLATVWRTPPAPTLPGDGQEPTFPDGPMVPPPGGTHVQYFQLPPDAVVAAALEEDPGLMDGFMAELTAKVPDLAEAISEENPALHATASVDYVILLSGSVVLELDDGATVELHPGDVVVQNGTPHAWHNPGDEPALLVAVLVGTPPRSGS